MPLVVYVFMEEEGTIRGIDKNGTIYFERAGVGRLGFPLPVLPEGGTILQIEATSNFRFLNDDLIKISEIYLPPEIEYFVAFAKKFALLATTLPVGDSYYSDDESFKISYLPQIVARVKKGKKWEETPLDTPARVNRLTGDIELNAEKFRAYTVPIRMFMLLHEFMHYYFNSASETEVDLQALRVYLALGFGKIDAVYALTKVLKDSPLAIERVDLLISYLKMHQNNEA